MSKSPDITFYFLNASRGIRIAWLLEELDLPYNLVASPRAKNGTGPPEFKAKIPNPLGKSPTLQDGNVVVTESGAIAEYLCEYYDTNSRLIPKDPQSRAKVLEWIHASEGSFMMQAIPVLYIRWRTPEAAKQYLPELEQSFEPSVAKNFDWLEGELKTQKSKGNDWLVGEHLTAADIVLQFSVQWIIERKLANNGFEGGKWPEIKAWLERTYEVPSYKKAVEKTGYSLYGDFRK